MTELDLNENIIVVAKYDNEVLSVSCNGKELEREDYSVQGDIIMFSDGYIDTVKLTQGESGPRC